MNDATEERDLAVRAAHTAAEIVMGYFGRADVREKGPANLVTQADVEAEEAIVRLIAGRFPSHAFLREEGGSDTDPTTGPVWIIDPLDGTNNYAQGIPHFAVSIAFADAGRVKTGVVCDPIRSELFTAIEGQGAFLNGQPIRVSDRGALTESVFATGFYYDRGKLMERTLDRIKDLFHRHVRGFRRTGAAALDAAWVACGRFDAFFEYRLAPWDYAAAALIVSEAGGRCADRAGRPLRLDSRSVVMANAGVFDEFLDVVKWEEDR